MKMRWYWHPQNDRWYVDRREDLKIENPYDRTYGFLVQHLLLFLPKFIENPRRKKHEY